MLLTLKATLYSVLASLSGNLTLQIHAHPQLPVIFPGAMICIFNLQGTPLDPQLCSLAAASPLSHPQTKQMLHAWNASISFFPLCSGPVSASPVPELDYLTPAVSRVLWTLEPSECACWSILRWSMLGSVLVALAQSCFAECSPSTQFYYWVLCLKLGTGKELKLVELWVWWMYFLREKVQLEYQLFLWVSVVNILSTLPAVGSHESRWGLVQSRASVKVMLLPWFPSVAVVWICLWESVGQQEPGRDQWITSPWSSGAILQGKGGLLCSQALQQFCMPGSNVFQLCTAEMGGQSIWSICCQINVQSCLLNSGLSQGAAWVTATGRIQRREFPAL